MSSIEAEGHQHQSPQRIVGIGVVSFGLLLVDLKSQAIHQDESVNRPVI